MGESRTEGMRYTHLADVGTDTLDWIEHFTVPLCPTDMFIYCLEQRAWMQDGRTNLLVIWSS